MRDWIRGTLVRWLAWLLGLANARGGDVRGFYDLKDRLLRRWGTRDGEDLQRIVKECWGYEEDGRCLGASCRRCGGTGIWERKLIRLERWALGGRIFHRPIGRVWGAPWDGWVTIEGRITHDGVDWYDSAEALLWLALLFDRRLFWRALTSSCRKGWKGWRPMLRLQRVAFFAGMRVRAGRRVVRGLVPHCRWCWDCERYYWTRDPFGARCGRCTRALYALHPHLETDDDLPF